jgi:hypothetical protein
MADITTTKALLRALAEKAARLRRFLAVQLACFPEILDHFNELLEVGAGTHLRRKGLGYVRGNWLYYVKYNADRASHACIVQDAGHYS